MAASRDPDLEDLLKAVNDAAGSSRTLFFTLMVLAVYLLIVVSGTDDLALLRNATVAVPTLSNATLPAWSFYVCAPLVQECDIVRSDDHGVTYRWCDGKTGKHAQRTMPGVEFLRLVLQHVLPKGFRRARCYGLLYPNCRRGVALTRTMAFRRRSCVPAAPSPAMAERPRLVCH